MRSSQWSGGGGGGGRHHPYRGPQDQRAGVGTGHRTGPGGFAGGFQDNNGDGVNFVKLFVGALPRTATEEEVRPLFEEYGNVIEVVFIKDRRTGEQQNCGFIKYRSLEEAEKAITALHNQYSLPGGTGPIQVRFADGERERLGIPNSVNVLHSATLDPDSTLGRGASQFKLFVANLNKQATEKEMEDIFSPYGRVEDVFILKNEMQLNRCCFIKLETRDMAIAAMNALNGNYVMSGCDHPLIVRCAVPKKPKVGESRVGPAFWGRGCQSCSRGTLGPRQTKSSESVDGDMPYNTSHPVSPCSFGSSSQFEQLQTPQSVSIPAVSQDLQQQDGQLSDSHSSVQQNAPLQNPLGIQGEGESALYQEQLPVASVSQQLLRSPHQQSPLPLTQQNGRPQLSFNAPASAWSSTVPLSTNVKSRIHCYWSEHICPDGFKYYYNCMTHESRWEKPEEYAVYKQEQQKLQL